MTHPGKSEPKVIYGDLVYIMGASGVGKDSLLNYARAALASHKKLVFAHRYITRPVELGGENHIALTPDEFEQRQQAGCFAMNWGAHNKRYGIGIEIEVWRKLGNTVIVNGSRNYFDQAQTKYPNIKPVLISASKKTIQNRLINRAREPLDEVEQRMKRISPFNNDTIEGLVEIDNNGTLADAGQELVRYIHKLSFITA